MLVKDPVDVRNMFVTKYNSISNDILNILREYIGFTPLAFSAGVTPKEWCPYSTLTVTYKK